MRADLEQDNKENDYHCSKFGENGSYNTKWTFHSFSQVWQEKKKSSTLIFYAKRDGKRMSIVCADYITDSE